MNDPRRPEWSDPTQVAGYGYPPNVDPAYSGQYYQQPYYGQDYRGQDYRGQGYGVQGYGSPMTNPTQQLPASWQPGGGYPPTEPPPPPPQPPKSPRWLWIAAAIAVLLVVGLVIALVIVMGSSKESTVVAPLPSAPEPTATTSRPNPTTTTRIPTRTTTAMPSPTTTAPTTPLVPGETPNPTGTDTVVYNVSGDGRAINITYVDTGGVMQTEFNVMLPWSKEVTLSAPARSSASVAIVNVGRDVTCSVSVNGVQVRQRTGRGLTICTGTD